jgi:hypothetical protein
LTIEQVAIRLSRASHEVHILTDNPDAVTIEGVQTHVVSSLRPSNGPAIIQKIKLLSPDVTVVLPTPLNMLTSAWLDKVPGRVIGFASYPFYTSRELLRALRYLGWAVTKQYLRHMLIPDFLWSLRMRQRLDGMIVQSSTTAERMRNITQQSYAVAFVPPGLDLAAWPWGQQQNPNARVELLFLGAAIPIRGFDILVDAISRLCVDDIGLRILARRAA